jgi:TonB family protein
MIARFLIFLGLLLAPLAILTSAPANAQMGAACSAKNDFTERWNTRRYEYRAQGIEVSNACEYTIKLYYCFSYDPSPESCPTAGAFSWVTLSPGASRRLPVNDSDSIRYMHETQCFDGDTLIDWRSQFTTARGPRCQSPLPANVNRSAYPGEGAAAASGAPKAQLRSSNLFAGDEYPQNLLGSLAEGRTVARIAVSPQGRATGCHIVSSAGFYDMDRALCTLFMRRARFNPALDAAGNAVEGQYEAKVTWTAP